MGSIVSSILGGGAPGGQPAGQAATPQAGAVAALAQTPQMPGCQAGIPLLAVKYRWRCTRCRSTRVPR